MGKGVSAVGVIGGADGPTSFFAAGKNGKIKWSSRIKRAIYNQKKKWIAKRITANPHTLEEVCSFLQSRYGAVELSSQSYEYLQQKKYLKESLILRHKPELLGELADIRHPQKMDDDGIQEFLSKVELRSQKAEEIPEDQFPMDCHIYEIERSDGGNLQICIEKVWNKFGVSYSGPKKKMKELGRMAREIYLYYGVTEEDIQSYSERYQALVMVLCR